MAVRVVALGAWLLSRGASMNMLNYLRTHKDEKVFMCSWGTDIVVYTDTPKGVQGCYYPVNFILEKAKSENKNIIVKCYSTNMSVVIDKNIMTV